MELLSTHGFRPSCLKWEDSSASSVLSGGKVGHLHSQKKQPEGLTPYRRGHLHKVGGPSKSREENGGQLLHGGHVQGPGGQEDVANLRGHQEDITDICRTSFHSRHHV